MIDKNEFKEKLEYYNVPFNYDKKYDFIYKNGDTILEIIENVTGRFLNKYFLDKDTLQDYILNIIINKCGNLFINYNEESIQKIVIQKYCLNHCKKLFLKEQKNKF